MFWLGLFIGIVVGIIVALVAVGLCRASKSEDEAADAEWEANFLAAQRRDCTPAALRTRAPHLAVVA